jgi:hypothetical protein
LSSFWLVLKQKWTIEEISIFSNSSHLEWRAWLSHKFERDPSRFLQLSISALVQVKMSSNFNCSYMARSSLTYILGFFCEIFSASLFRLGILWDQNGRGCRTQYWKGTTPAKFVLIWFSGFRGEDLNVIFYQNMPNLHNLYKSAERKISIQDGCCY